MVFNTLFMNVSLYCSFWKFCFSRYFLQLANITLNCRHHHNIVYNRLLKLKQNFQMVFFVVFQIFDSKMSNNLDLQYTRQCTFLNDTKIYLFQQLILLINFTYRHRTQFCCFKLNILFNFNVPYIGYTSDLESTDENLFQLKLQNFYMFPPNVACIYRLVNVIMKFIGESNLIYSLYYESFECGLLSQKFGAMPKRTFLKSTFFSQPYQRNVQFVFL